MEKRGRKRDTRAPPSSLSSRKRHHHRIRPRGHAATVGSAHNGHCRHRILLRARCSCGRSTIHQLVPPPTPSLMSSSSTAAQPGPPPWSPPIAPWMCSIVEYTGRLRNTLFLVLYPSHFNCGWVSACVLLVLFKSL